MESYVSIRNLDFLLFEVLDVKSIKKFAYYADYDEDLIRMTLAAAKEFADKELFPFADEMDKKKAVMQNGIPHVHPQLKNIIQGLADSGWIASHSSHDWGGSQMPLMVLNSASLIFFAANINSNYAFLTQGASNLIYKFGSEVLKNTYIPKMYNGTWQGTMALTEPQAGSSLSDITTSAVPTYQEGVYKILGQKIYISGGDHDATKNVVHLLLARIKGAPLGVKGISLFVVPKYLPDSHKTNHVTTAGIYGKMGQKGYVAAHLMFGEQGDCLGYLVGEPHKGLSYMFQMMNEARIGTGIAAAGLASAAYYSSLKFAHERPQGRHPQSKNPADPQIAIIEHADIKRLLFYQKSIVEGSIALLTLCSYYADIASVSDGEEKRKAHLLLELLTPLAKTYPSEMGNFSTSAAMQILGGAGYCDDYPIERLYRDIRINAIYEGTTAIHGLDILGRKIVIEDSAALFYFKDEVVKTIGEAAKINALKPFAQDLVDELTEMIKTIDYLMRLGKVEGATVMLSNATLFLEYFGIVTIGWMWLKQAIVAEIKLSENAVSENDKIFYESKLATNAYYFAYELPKSFALRKALIEKSHFLTLQDKKVFV